MIDIHCHLLPKIDDGSDSEEKSLQQLRLMADGGIKHAFMTTHFMSGLYKYSRSEYDTKLADLQSQAKASGIGIKLHQGFEIYLHPNSLDDISKNNLVLGSSRYILVESDLNGLPEDFYENLYPLLRKGYKPILAHAERYVSIMNKPKDARDLISRDIYMQVNAGSLLGLYGEAVRQTAWVLVRNGWAHLLASDDHVRTPYGAYFKAVELLKEDIDNDVVALLTEEFPQMVLDNKPIPFKYVYVQRSHHKHHRKKKSLWRRLFS